MRKLAMLLLWLLSFELTACEATITSSSTVGTPPSVQASTEVDPTTSSKKPNPEDTKLVDTITKFVDAIHDDDPKPFKELMDQDGLFSISYFVDDRDPNRVVHVYPDDVSENMVLVNSKNDIGITLLVLNFNKISKASPDFPIINSEQLKGISFDVDWHHASEKDIEKQLKSIYQTCNQLILINNEYNPQLFILNNNYVVLTKSKAAPDDLSDFTGDWAVFEKINGDYKLRVLMNFT
ncbi:hypothetical protein [Paenibacillus sp. CGMCC 1.18879]|uniref:hypothetical protein n=1 Tax=Paenibacillus sp. CGMCC 1.18879 TaxID=2834466 RepID=UPI001CA9A365|nr:hypothetical protein [Paenibacillus sp. CGMCC 1.18879]MBY9078998.1 hypothetical protein [Paenibacillus sp. CGMCC 1.18879]